MGLDSLRLNIEGSSTISKSYSLYILVIQLIFLWLQFQVEKALESVSTTHQEPVTPVEPSPAQTNQLKGIPQSLLEKVNSHFCLYHGPLPHSS